MILSTLAVRLVLSVSFIFFFFFKQIFDLKTSIEISIIYGKRIIINFNYPISIKVRSTLYVTWNPIFIINNFLLHDSLSIIQSLDKSKFLFEYYYYYAYIFISFAS